MRKGLCIVAILAASACSREHSPSPSGVDEPGLPTLDELIEQAIEKRDGVVSGWLGRARILVEIQEELPYDESALTLPD